MSANRVNQTTGELIQYSGDVPTDKVGNLSAATTTNKSSVVAMVNEINSALAGKVSTASVGSANGVAELDANGRVPSSQLPSYVDDVLEYADLAHFPATGETGKIYIAEDTNKTYRWSGSNYAEISESLALGETSSTAYAGNKGKANADAIAGIKNGTSINSFGAVETALQSYTTKTYVDGLVGDPSSATTTDKSSVVAMVNEVDWKAGTFGTYTISNATDIRDFIKKLITQADADLASKPSYMLFNIFAVYSNVDVFYGTIERQDTHSYSYSLSRANGDYIYQGHYNMTIDSLTFYEFMSTNKSTTNVYLEPTYDAGVGWNVVKQGNICVMAMRNLKDVPNGTTKVATIPVGFRPEWGFYEYIYSGNTADTFGFQIGSDGDIYIFNNTGSTTGTIYVNRNITYFTA